MARFHVKIDFALNEPMNRFWEALRDFADDQSPAGRERLLQAARAYNEAAAGVAPGLSLQINGEEYGDRVRDVSLALKQLALAAPSVDDVSWLRSLGISHESPEAGE